MKKIVALALALILLLAAVPALAEEALCMRQLPQDVYILDTVLTLESYPEVRITPYTEMDLFSNYTGTVTPLFLCFPGPENARPNWFEMYRVHYLDTDNLIQYYYAVTRSDSWETFLNGAAKDEYILMDGSNGLAAYIDPDNLTAYGMIGTTEFGKSSKLVFSVRLDYLNSMLSIDQKISALTEAITAEVTRVSSQMRYETMEPYWNNGEITGIMFLNEYDMETMVKVTFPENTLHYSDGTSKTAGMIVTQLDSVGTLRGVYAFSVNIYEEVEIKLESHYSNSFLDTDDPDVKAITMESGRTWYLRMYGLSKDGKSSQVYAYLPLGFEDNNGGQFWLEIYLYGGSIYWSSFEDFAENVAEYDAGLKELKASDEPYVPSERIPAEPAGSADQAEPAPAQADNSGWVCPNCGTGNTGKFCTECGTAKPVSAEWTCPSCGVVNTGKFCPECGAARPAE